MRSMRPFAALLFTFVIVSPTFSLPENGTGVLISQIHDLTTVSITGKVKTPGGRPIKGAYIVIRDASTNAVVRSTYSSSFGYYRLEQIETGRSYVLSIAHRRFLFALPAQLLEINEDRTGVDFTGEPSDE